MPSGELARFLDRCHAPGASLDAWLSDLTPALAQLLSPREGVYLGAGEPPRGIRAEWASGRAERLIPNFQPAHANLPDDVLHAAWTPFLVTRLSRQLGRPALRRFEWFESTVGRFGYEDCIGVLASDGPLTLIVTIPLVEGDARSDRDPDLYRVRRHVLSALMARQPISAGDVVSDPAGRVLHAPPHAAVTRDLVRAASRAYDAERAGKPGGRDAERVWAELWRGGWSVVEVVDADGKRMLVLRRDPAKPGAQTLDARERRVLHLLAHGASHKRIALEIGTSVSVASDVATRALHKLGFKTRLDFVRHVGAARSPGG